MSKPDYTALDAQIIDNIRSGCNTAGKLTARLDSATKPFQTEHRCEMRVIDMRLQALRKAGKIRHGLRTKVWEVVA